jgi:hypothetical protein
VFVCVGVFPDLLFCVGILVLFCLLFVCHFLPPVFSGFKCLCMCVSKFVVCCSVVCNLVLL